VRIGNRRIARPVGTAALIFALGLVPLHSGCGEEGGEDRNGRGSSVDGGGDDSCAETRTALKSLDYWIAFDSNRDPDLNRDLYVMRPDGEEIRRLTTAGSVERYPRFSPDGTRLVFVSDRSGLPALYLLDLATKEESGPISRPRADFPDWSPDGKRIAFTSDGRLYDVRPDGSEERLLLDLFADYGIYIEHPAYSVNGRSYLFWDFIRGIGRCNLDGSGVKLLAKGDQRFGCRIGGEPHATSCLDVPSPAPNGVNVAVRAFCGPQDDTVFEYSSAIYLIPWDGTLFEEQSPCDVGVRVTPVAEPYDQNPRWGPGFIAYESGIWNRSIRVIESVAASSCSITDGAFDDRNPAWSPEGTIIP
jgi:hypothetical protein